MKRIGLNYTGNYIVFTKTFRGTGASSNLNLYQSHYIIFNVICSAFLCRLEFYHYTDEGEREKVDLCSNFPALDVSTGLHSLIFIRTHQSHVDCEKTHFKRGMLHKFCTDISWKMEMAHIIKNKWLLVSHWEEKRTSNWFVNTSISLYLSKI